MDYGSAEPLPKGWTNGDFPPGADIQMRHHPFLKLEGGSPAPLPLGENGAGVQAARKRARTPFIETGRGPRQRQRQITDDVDR